MPLWILKVKNRGPKDGLKLGQAGLMAVHAVTLWYCGVQARGVEVRMTIPRLMPMMMQ